MTIAIEVVDGASLLKLAEAASYPLGEFELQKLRALVLISQNKFVGLVEGQYACCWGLVPPSLMSDKAYLWLQTTPLAEENKFLFVRHSQRCIEVMLEEYGELVGFCRPDNAAAIRWIEWLGGDFVRPFGTRADFVIRRREVMEALCG